MSLRDLRSIIITSSVWLLIIAAIMALSVTGKLDILNINKLEDVIVANKDLLPGHVITGEDLMVAKVVEGMALPGALDAEEAIGKAVTSAINKYEQITDNRVDDAENFKGEDYKEYGVLITNTFPLPEIIGEYVDIMVSYKTSKKPDVVLSKVPVKYLKSLEGAQVSDEANLTSVWVYFDLDKESMALVDDANKAGTIFLAKYPYEDMEASEVTYKPSWIGGAVIDEQ